LAGASTNRFLRARNCEGGCDVYVQPYAGRQNAGYILVDLDRARPTIIDTMRAQRHDPYVVVQTSPGHWQAWIHLNTSPLERQWRPPPANCWLPLMEAIGPAPTGVTGPARRFHQSEACTPHAARLRPLGEGRQRTNRQAETLLRSARLCQIHEFALQSECT
jgi:hypothetical protein